MNDQDRQLIELGRQARPIAMGARTTASTAAGAHASAQPSVSTTIVDENHHIKREWLMGNPWTDDYYFKY